MCGYTNDRQDEIKQHGDEALSVKITSNEERVTNALITTSSHRLIVKTSRTTINGDGANPTGWYELEVTASPNADENIAPFRLAGVCADFLEEIVSLHEWLQRYGVAEVGYVYKLITHLV